MSRERWLLPALAWLMAACGGERAESARPSDDTAPSTARQTYRGVVRLGVGPHEFRPCGDSVARRLLDSTGGELTRIAPLLEPGPGGGIYVELRGAVARAPSVGESGAIVAKELRRAAIETASGTRCEPPPGELAWRAFGNEPFWDVRVFRDSVILTQPDQPARILFSAPSVGPRDGQRSLHASAEGPDRHVLQITLEERRCTDAMSGELTAFVAHATLDGRPLEGCATEGPAILQ